MEKTLLQSGPSERAQSSWVFIFQAAPESEVSCCHPLPQIGIGKQRLAYLEFQQNWKREEFNFLLLWIHMWRVGWERSHERPSLGEGAGWYWVLLGLSGVLLIPVTLVECPLSFLPTPHCWRPWIALPSIAELMRKSWNMSVPGRNKQSTCRSWSQKGSG